MKKQRINTENIKEEGSVSARQPVRRELPDPDKPLKSFKEYQREMQRATEPEKAAVTAADKEKRLKKTKNRRNRKSKRQPQKENTCRERGFAVPEQEKPRRRVTKAQLRRKQRLRKFGLVLLVAAVLTVGTVLTVTLLFKTENFRIEGESRYTEQELCEAAGIVQGENMFSFKLKESEENIFKKLPYVESIKVRRRLPDTVVFFVETAREAFAVKTENNWLVLSENLKILRLSGEAPAGAATVYGITAEKGEAGEYFECTDAEKKQTLNALLSCAANYNIGNITEVNLEDIYNIWFVTDNRFKIIVGTTVEMDYKLRLVEKVINEELADTPKAVIDAGSANSTKSVTVRKNDF